MKQRQKVLDSIKEKLLKKQEELAEQLESQSQDKSSDGNVKDSGDEALSVTIDKLQNAVEQTEIDELHLIEDALKRLEKGEFGLCVDCSEPISDARLEHFPYAARCIVCQERFESQDQ